MVQPNKLINRLAEKLQSDHSVCAFALVGSQARTSIYVATPFSDMEAYIVVEDKALKEFEKNLPQLVKDLGKIIFSYKNQFSGFSVVFDDLFRLELPVVKKSNLQDVFSRPKAQTVKVLVDKTGGELERILDQRPEQIDFEALFNYRVTDFWYMAILTVQYFKKGEIWNSRSAFHTLNSSLIKLLELKKDRNILLLETNKRIEEFLRDDLGLLETVSPSYNKLQIKNAILKMLEIFPEIAKSVAEKYGYNYPSELEISVKPKLLKLLS